MLQTDHNGRSGSREGLVSHGTGSRCRSALTEVSLLTHIWLFLKRPKTKERVIKFQQKHNISPASGIVGPKTWKALLERWAALRPLPLA
jgi:hypothetical protein